MIEDGLKAIVPILDAMLDKQCASGRSLPPSLIVEHALMALYRSSGCDPHVGVLNGNADEEDDLSVTEDINVQRGGETLPSMWLKHRSLRSYLSEFRYKPLLSIDFSSCDLSMRGDGKNRFITRRRSEIDVAKVEGYDYAEEARSCGETQYSLSCELVGKCPSFFSWEEEGGSRKEEANNCLSSLTSMMERSARNVVCAIQNEDARRTLVANYAEKVVAYLVGTECVMHQMLLSQI